MDLRCWPSSALTAPDRLTTERLLERARSMRATGDSIRRAGRNGLSVIRGRSTGKGPPRPAYPTCYGRFPRDDPDDGVHSGIPSPYNPAGGLPLLPVERTLCCPVLGASKAWHLPVTLPWAMAG